MSASQKIEGAKAHLAGPTIFSTIKPSGQAGFYSIPTWILYLIGALILAALIWGGVQQFRVWRWSRILEASKTYIAKLEASKATAHYEGVKQATSRAVANANTKIQQVDDKLKKLEGRQKQTTQQIQTMTPQQLKEAFHAEGF